jgi:ribose transport system substrate-binding protein
MRTHRFTMVLILVLLVAVIYAVLYSKVLSVASNQGQTVTVVLKSLNVRSDFWQTVSAGAQVAARQAGVKIDLAGPLQETDAEAQIQALEQAIVRKPQAIVVAPINDTRMPGIIRRIRSAGIRLIIMDTPLDIEEPKPLFVGNNHVEAGRLAGKTVAQLTDNRPVAAIIGDSEHSVITSERIKGVEESLTPYSDSMYGTYYCDDSEDRAYQIARIILHGKHPINAFVTLNEAATLGVAKAIKNSGNVKPVRLIGFDSSVYEIQLLEDGVLNATIVQKPFNMGYLGVRMALDLLDGKPAPSNTFIDSTVITRSNMYTPENQKLLFPFIQTN